MKKSQFAILIAVIVLCAGGIFGYIKYESSKKEQCEIATCQNNESTKEECECITCDSCPKGENIDYTKTTAYTDFVNKYNQKLESLKESFVNNSNSTDSYYNLRETKKVDCSKNSDGYYKDYNDCYYAMGIDKNNSSNSIDGYFILAKSIAKNGVASWSIRYNKELDEFGYNGDTSVFDIYNVNLDNGKELTSKQLLSIFNISDERFNKIIKEYYTNDMYKYFYSVSNNEGLGDGYNNIKDNAVDYQFGLLHEVFENIVNKKIEIDNTYYKPNDYKMFINSNGYLNVIMNPIHGICAGAAYCEGVAGLEIIEIN